MSTQDDDNQGLILALVFGLILLVIGLVIGIALHRAGQRAVPAVAAAPAPMAVVEVVEGAAIRVEGGVVKFFFASGSAAVAEGAQGALAEVVKGVAAGKMAVISGFHDTTGDPALNEELAKQRAQAVRAVLQSLGIGEDKLNLKKPEVTTASGSNAEARRVEVTLE
ncbi:MAG: OmpA family protein [Proteobacteria bacterium]|jgi:outer membrane protein OmpA-like peptidoglycan-associated protein|nr:OmpA family protein [Pseudomonadota bacterium]